MSPRATARRRTSPGAAAPPSSSTSATPARSGRLTLGGRPWRHTLHDLAGDPLRTARFVRERRRFASRDDDVFVATYPRSGTTWLTYLCWCLLQPDHPDKASTPGTPPDLDAAAPPFAHLSDVVPWFERSLARGYLSAGHLDALTWPRVFKSHLLPRWLPERGRVVVGVREVADVAVSYWRLYQSHLGYQGSLPMFAEAMAAGRVQYGAWSDHTGAWARVAARPSVLLVRYEALRASPATEVDRIAAHLGVVLDDARRARVLAQTSREVMKRYEDRFDHATSPGHGRPDAARAQFIGAGSVGHGASALSEEVLRKLRGEAGRPLRPGLAAFLR